MPPSNPLCIFHQWLLASPVARSSSRTIVLHGGSHLAFDPLISEIAVYLNEYDEEGAGRWLAATSELIGKIAANPDSLSLLAGNALSSQPLDPTDLPGILSALGRRGHVILRHDAPENTNPDLPAAFHAGIGNSNCGCARCHMVLNPELVHPRSLAHIVSDVFLDWHEEAHRRDLPESTRNATPSAIHEQTRFQNPASV